MFAELISLGKAGGGISPLASCDGWGGVPTGPQGHCTSGGSPRTGKCIDGGGP